MVKTSKRAALERRTSTLACKAPELDQTVRGTLVERYLTCGKPQCRCHSGGPRHGPYHYLLTTVPSRKTRTTLVSKHQLAKVRGWVRNYRRLKDLLENITELNTELLRLERSDEPKATRKKKGRRSSR